MKFWVNQNSENRIFIQMMEQKKKKKQGKESSFEFMMVSVVEIHFVHRFFRVSNLQSHIFCCFLFCLVSKVVVIFYLFVMNNQDCFLFCSFLTIPLRIIIVFSIEENDSDVFLFYLLVL